MKLLDIYSLLLAHWLNGGNDAKAGRLHADSIDAQYNLIFTKGYVKQIYRLAGVKPINFDVAYIDYIRDRMFELHPNIELNINVVQHPIKMSVTDDKFNRAMSKASDAYQTYSDAFNSQSGINRLMGKTYRLPGGGRLRLSRDKLDDLQQVAVSYYYLYNNITSGGSVALTNVFFEVIGKDAKEVRRAGDDLYGIIGPLSMGLELVKSANKAYMLEMGPAVGSPRTVNKKFLPQLLFSQENTAAFTSYKSRGLVGDTGTSAILMGQDWRSKLPFSIDPFRSGNAQIFMVLGKSGSGKTYSCFQTALSLLAIGCHLSVIDIKGNEWSAIAGAVSDTKIISFDSKNQSFVNTLRLDDMLVAGLSPNDSFNTAVNGTVQLMMLLINLAPGEGNPSDAEMVVREAVMKLYSMKSVDPSNPTSFLNTKDMTYAEILPILESLSTTVSYTDEQKYMLKLARSRLHNYFGPSGLFADMFRNEITLGDILTSRFVIYEFNKNSGTIESSLDPLRIFMVQFLDTKKMSILKLQGKFIACMYEELQRCENFGDLLTFICHQVTGARSNNALIFLLLNSLKVFQGKAGQDLRSNITSVIAGWTEENDIEFLESQMNKGWVADQLRLFSAKQQVYRNCFACSIDTGKNIFETVYKVALPPDISKRLRTRTIVED